MNRLSDWLEASARQQPAALALLTPHGRLTYSGLADLGLRGRAFLQDNELRAGDIAAIGGNANQLAIAAVACSAANLALLPLDPITADARWPALQTLGGKRIKRCAPLPAQLDNTNHRAATTYTQNDLALVIATSGSEGTPKAVMLTHANLDAAARASNERLPLTTGDIWLDCLPLYHIGGISILYRCIRAGATLLLHEGFDAAAVWHDLQSEPVTHISLVPAMLAHLLDCAGDAPPPDALRHVLVGGAALSGALFKRAQATGWPICPTWGMSECAAQAATLLQPDAHWREGNVGSLLPGFETRLDATGRILLRGPQVMAGYLNPECQPGIGLDNGWLTTADLGLIGDGGAITLLGRADDMLISGGVNVHPIEVESCLAACPGVTDVAVTAIADPVWGDVLVALIVGSADSHTVRDWSRQHLASALRPRRMLRVASLPRNAMGKIERATLRTLAGGAA